MKGPKKAFYVMVGVLAVILAIGLGTFYYFDSLFGSNASEIADLKADDAILDERLRKAKEVEQQLADIQFLVPIIDEVLPSNKEQSNLVGELTKIEQETNVTLTEITFPGSDLADTKTPDLTQTENLESLGTVKLLPVTTGFQCASFNQFLDFLSKTEENRRKMQVTNVLIDLRDDPADVTCPVGNLDVKVTLEVYIKP